MDLTSYLLGKNSGGGSINFTLVRGTSNSDPGWHHLMEQIPEVKTDETSLTYAFYGYKGKSVPKIIGSKPVTNFNSAFASCSKATKVDLSGIPASKVVSTSAMFSSATQLAVIDISTLDFTDIALDSSAINNMFTGAGGTCYVTDGAYAYSIPYVYVKDVANQTWVLNATNGHKSNWSTSNVIVKQ